MNHLIKSALAILLLLGTIISSPQEARADRLYDVCDVLGVRDNQLVGYGVVTGLDRTGDDVTAPFAMQSLRALLRRLGVQLDERQLRLRNVAAVIVTADLPPYARSGTRLDVTVSSIGNARSLRGGVLVITPLRGADSHSYAVAQGAVITGGFNSSGRSGSSIQSNSTNTARVPSGALVERQVKFELGKDGSVTLTLKRANFRVAQRVAEAVSKELGAGSAVPIDAGAVKIKTPGKFKKKEVEMLASLADIEIVPDTQAMVVINERTGTVVAGGDVRLLPVAISQGGITISVRETPNVVQPGAFSNGRTERVNQSDVEANEDVSPLTYVDGAASLAEVAEALSIFGVSPRELASILQALKTSGALRAEVVVQ